MVCRDEGRKKMAEGSEKQATQTELDRTARSFRHIGFAIFGGLAAVLAGTLAYAAITGYMANEVYDPVTGENVMGGTELPDAQDAH